MMAFRKANADLNWYTEGYRKHVTLKDAKLATPESVKPLWEGLTREIKAFPNVVELKLEYWNDLLPAYVQAGAIEGKVKVASVIEGSLEKQAVSELG